MGRATEVFAKHENEWDEDTKIQARPLDTPSVYTTGFILCRQTSADTGL